MGTRKAEGQWRKEGVQMEGENREENYEKQLNEQGPSCLPCVTGGMVFKIIPVCK